MQWPSLETQWHGALVIRCDYIPRLYSQGDWGVQFRITGSHITLFDLEEGRAANFVSKSFSFSIYSEFSLDLGLSSWIFSSYLEKSFCEVDDKQYGEVKVILSTFGKHRRGLCSFSLLKTKPFPVTKK